jgi:hypothetical protein
VSAAQKTHAKRSVVRANWGRNLMVGIIVCQNRYPRVNVTRF